jgi:hypothetical protein
MDIATAVVDVVIGLWIIAVIVGVIRAWQARTPQLRPLPEDAVNRFRQAWEQIAARFVNEPLEAVNEADALVLSLLREKGHPLDYERLPGRMREARRQRISGQEREGTEALRQSLLNYRAVFEQMLRDQGRMPAAARRREMA